MGQIKTNYNTDSKLVLVNEENNVVAIINVSKGSDITESLRLAIKEELIAKEVVFETDIEIGEFEYEKEISFIYSDEEEEEFHSNYNVYKTCEY